MAIHNMKELEKVVNKYIIKALELTRDEIFDVVSRKVSDYYNEEVFAHEPYDIPDFYQRTGNLMESLSATNITSNGSGYEFRVGWDDDYLTFRYPKGFGKSKYNGITGLQVLQAFDSGTHGYTVQGNHNYWTEALDELGNEKGIIELFKKNCKRVGLNITN